MIAVNNTNNTLLSRGKMHIFSSFSEIAKGFQIIYKTVIVLTFCLETKKNYSQIEQFVIIFSHFPFTTLRHFELYKSHNLKASES